MLKNWTTVFQTVKQGQKGLMRYLRYLSDSRHPNHLKEGHRVIMMKGWEKVFGHISFRIDQARTKQILKRKGGRPPSKYAHSITLNLPFRLEDERAKSIMKKVLWRFMKALVDHERLYWNDKEANAFLRDYVFYNIHTQKEGSRTQFNIVMCEYLSPDKKIDLSQKRYSHLFKQIGNDVMLEYGYDYTRYQIKRSGRHRKRIPTGAYKAQRLDEGLEEINQMKAKFEMMQERYRERYGDLSPKVQKRVDTYLRRATNAIEAHDLEKFFKNYERIMDNLLRAEAELNTREKRRNDPSGIGR